MVLHRPFELAASTGHLMSDFIYSITRSNHCRGYQHVYCHENVTAVAANREQSRSKGRQEREVDLPRFIATS
jgi:hypothetical protein